MRDLIADGNSVLLVDHDIQILRESDWLIEMGPKAGAYGGRVIAEGTLSQIEANPDSLIAPFLKGSQPVRKKAEARRAEGSWPAARRRKSGGIRKASPAGLSDPPGFVRARKTPP